MSDTSEGAKYEYTPSIDALDRCVVCGVAFGGEDDRTHLSQDENFTHGPVWNADTGTEYEYVGESPPGAHLAHRECFKEVDAERKAESNHSLVDFPGGPAMSTQPAESPVTEDEDEEIECSEPGCDHKTTEQHIFDKGRCRVCDVRAKRGGDD